jgi:hypothetical protein
MAKIKKPYPGMGAFVVLITERGGTVYIHAGANTEEAARRKGRQLHPTYDWRVAPNNPGDPRETTY